MTPLICIYQVHLNQGHEKLRIQVMFPA